MNQFSGHTSPATGEILHAHPGIRRRKPLHERRRLMPIIDVAGEPLEKLEGHWQRHALTYFLWFRVLRPLLLIGVWAAMAAYAWIQITGVARQQIIWTAVELGGLGILMVPLMVLPVRLLHAVRKNAPQSARYASVAQLARYARLSAKELSGFQHSSFLLSVDHDESGYIRTVRKVKPGNTVPAELDDFEATHVLHR